MTLPTWTLIPETIWTRTSQHGISRGLWFQAAQVYLYRIQGEFCGRSYSNRNPQIRYLSRQRGYISTILWQRGCQHGGGYFPPCPPHVVSPSRTPAGSPPQTLKPSCERHRPRIIPMAVLPKRMPTTSMRSSTSKPFPIAKDSDLEAMDIDGNKASRLAELLTQRPLEFRSICKRLGRLS